MFYLSNITRVSMSLYSYINTRDVERTREKGQNHEPEAGSGLKVSRYNYIDPANVLSTKSTFLSLRLAFWSFGRILHEL